MPLNNESPKIEFKLKFIGKVKFKKDQNDTIRELQFLEFDITLDSGCKYSGETTQVNNKSVPHGQGTLQYPNGELLTGNFKNGSSFGRVSYYACHKEGDSLLPYLNTFGAKRGSFMDLQVFGETISGVQMV